MPCWQDRSVEIDFSKASKPLMKQALESLGLRVTETSNGLVAYGEYGDENVRWENGVLKTYETNAAWGRKVGRSIDQVKQAYASVAIDATVKRFAGWKAVKNGNKTTLTRGF